MRALDKKNIEDILPLTPMQEGMLFYYLKDPGSGTYFEQICLDISGEINVDLFEKAWNFIIETNEMLRAVFRWEKVDHPMQIVLKEHKLQSRYYDCSNLSGDINEKKKRLEEIREKDRKEKFELDGVPFRITLSRIEKCRYEMIISYHHILCDGWSIGIILKEFVEVYDEFCKNNTSLPSVNPKGKFKEFIKWVQNQDTGGQEKFWRNYLKGFDTQTELSIKRRKRKEVTGIERYQIRFEKEVKSQLEGFVKKYKVTLASLLYTAWGHLLQKYNDKDDIVFGTTVSGRSTQITGIENIVGLFINTVPLRIQANPNEKGTNLLYRLDKALQTRKEYEATSLLNIKKYSEIDNKEELFDTIVIIENYPLAARLISRSSNLSVESYSIFEMTHYDLALTITITIFADIELIFTYVREKFDEYSIVSLANHFIGIVRDIIGNPGKKAIDIEIMSEEERKQVLFEFNNTAVDYPMNKTINQLFEEQAEKTCDNIAVIFKDKRLTYRKLNEKSNRLAGLLRANGIKRDSLVGLMPERSIEMIIGLFAILKAGGAYIPIGPEYPEERIKYILEECGTEILLTTGDKNSSICRPIKIDNCESYKGDASNLPPINAPTDLAYVIYTSGSTGKPKGVMIENSSVSNFITGITNIISFTENDMILSLTTLSFDIFGLETILPLVKGSRVVIGSEEEQLNPAGIASIIAREKITILQVTPSRLQLIIEDRESSKNLKLLTTLVVGGEPFPEILLKKTRSLIKGKIYNVYGPTETTIWSTIKDVSEKEPLNIGKPIANTRIYILSRGGLVQPPGVPGELCIGGAGVARGYFKNDQLTKETFIENPFVAGERIYKTGDLARWLPDGNIEFLGRIDHQVKIRGFRIELGDIENQLLAHDAVKETVVLAKGSEENKFLCAYVVLSKKLESFVTELKYYLSKILPDYMVPTCFVQMDRIPLTPNGKINRKVLPEPETGYENKYAAPRNEREETLVRIWAEVLGMGEKQIGIDDNFFQLGGNSLTAMRLINKVHRKFDFKIPLTEMVKIPTVREHSFYMNRASKSTYRAISPAEKKEYYVTSPGQRRLYIYHQIDKNNLVHNLTSIMVLEGNVVLDKFEKIFRSLITRHESLRTSFELINDEPVQKINPFPEVKFQIEDYPANAFLPPTSSTGGPISIENIIKKFIRPFDLSQAPLIRVGLIAVEKNKSILMVDMHHIAADGLSHSILVEDFISLYKCEALPELELQYKDYSEWQNRNHRQGSEAKKQQEKYWLEQFKAEIPRLNMPVDYTGTKRATNRGSTICFEIEEQLTTKIKKLTAAAGTTLYTVLMASFNILLAKYTGQDDIVVTSGISGRTHADMEKIIGMFVNILAIRNHPKADLTFVQFLEEVKETTLNAVKNQDYQFDQLVMKLGIPREYGRNPFFEAGLTLQNYKQPELILPALKLTPYNLNKQVSEFDLHLYAVDNENTIPLTLEYSTELYKRTTVEEIAKDYIELLAQVAENKDIRLNDITIAHSLYSTESSFSREEYNDFKF